MDIYGDSIYISVSNRDSITYFPNNKAEHFHVKLAKRLELTGSWKIAICEINVSNVIIITPPGVGRRRNTRAVSNAKSMLDSVTNGSATPNNTIDDGDSNDDADDTPMVVITWLIIMMLTKIMILYIFIVAFVQV